MSTLVSKIDQALGQYYKALNVEYFTDNTNQGKFYKFCEENGMHGILTNLMLFTLLYFLCICICYKKTLMMRTSKKKWILIHKIAC